MANAPPGHTLLMAAAHRLESMYTEGGGEGCGGRIVFTKIELHNSHHSAP